MYVNRQFAVLWSVRGNHLLDNGATIRQIVKPLTAGWLDVESLLGYSAKSVLQNCLFGPYSSFSKSCHIWF